MSSFSRSELQRIREAIAALPEPTRSIYRLHLWDGLDYHAVGEWLELDVAEVERRICEAIVLIDRELRRKGREGALR